MDDENSNRTPEAIRRSTQDAVEHDETTNRDTDAVAYEQQHVHEVYEQIASHFSSTRYKPWPIVERFLAQQARGAIGLDVGCGNGKNMRVRDDVFIVGSDRSRNLIAIAATAAARHGAVVADTLALPHPRDRFDFAICIAVVHHLSTPARRQAALRDMLRCLRRADDARALVYVWALEQKDSRRGWDDGHDQDVMVPWVLKARKEKKTRTRADNAPTALPPSDQVFERYYHLYRKGELEHDLQAAGGTVLESGYEKDNWWAIACRKL